MGPVLFLILCNEITTLHENRVKFADDLSLLIHQKLGSMISTDCIVCRLETNCKKKKRLLINKKKAKLLKI